MYIYIIKSALRSYIYILYNCIHVAMLAKRRDQLGQDFSREPMGNKGLKIFFFSKFQVFLIPRATLVIYKITFSKICNKHAKSGPPPPLLYAGGGRG